MLETPEPVRANGDIYFLRGWVFSQDPEAIVDLALMVDGMEVPAFVGLSRHDVARNLRNPRATNCGFAVHFRHPRVDPKIQVIAKRGNIRIVLRELRCKQISTRRGSHPDYVSRAKSYEDWRQRWEPCLFPPAQETRLSALSYRPLISLVLSAFGANEYLLSRCIDSISTQYYGAIEICVCGDYSGDRRTEGWLAKAAAASAYCFFTAVPGQIYSLEPEPPHCSRRTHNVHQCIR